MMQGKQWSGQVMGSGGVSGSVYLVEDTAQPPLIPGLPLKVQTVEMSN